jgi:hypothetical protein
MSTKINKTTVSDLHAKILTSPLSSMTNSTIFRQLLALVLPGRGYLFHLHLYLQGESKSETENKKFEYHIFSRK